MSRNFPKFVDMLFDDHPLKCEQVIMLLNSTMLKIMQTELKTVTILKRSDIVTL